VARLHGRPKEIGQLREARAWYASREQTTRQRDGVDDGRREARAREPLRLAVEEREVEPRVVRDEDRVAREAEELVHRGSRGRRAAQLPVGEAGERSHRRAKRHARVDERLELVDYLEPRDLDCADLTDVRAAGP
jgi:hypothetical protein